MQINVDYGLCRRRDQLVAGAIAFILVDKRVLGLRNQKNIYVAQTVSVLLLNRNQLEPH